VRLAKWDELVALFVLTWSLSYGAWKVLRLEERPSRPA